MAAAQVFAVHSGLTSIVFEGGAAFAVQVVAVLAVEPAAVSAAVQAAALVAVLAAVQVVALAAVVLAVQVAVLYFPFSAKQLTVLPAVEVCSLVYPDL